MSLDEPRPDLPDIRDRLAECEALWRGASVVELSPGDAAARLARDARLEIESLRRQLADARRERDEWVPKGPRSGPF